MPFRRFGHGQAQFGDPVIGNLPLSTGEFRLLPRGTQCVKRRRPMY